MEKLRNINAQTLTQFMDDTHLHTFVGAIDDVANRRFGYAASHGQLVVGHFLFLHAFLQPVTDCLTEPHDLHHHSHNKNSICLVS